MSNNKSNINKEELISVFTEIDSKIASLHQCSSEDFTLLNGYLKEYHKKIRIIFENATSIFNLIGGEKGGKLVEELNQVKKCINTNRTAIEEGNSQNLILLESILAKVILLMVSLKNFRQDLTTYKFLVSNYILLTGYESGDNEENKIIFTWEKFVKYIRTLLPSLEKNLDEIKEDLYTTISKSKLFHERNRTNFKSLVKELESCLQMVEHKNTEARDGLPELTHKTDNASKSISNIITHLQYHDIIWQKFDHIKITHTKIISDLQHDLTDNVEDNMSNFIRVADISELQAAQLILINKEYQSAIEVIIRSFQQIALDLTSASNISYDFSFDNKTSEINLINQIKNKLDEGLMVLDLNSYNELLKEHNSIVGKIMKFSEEMKEIENKLSELKLDKASKTGSGSDNEQEEATKKRSLSQILSMASDVGSKLLSITESVKEIVALADEVHDAGQDPVWGHEMEKDRIMLMVNISKILDTLDTDNSNLESMLNHNKELSEQMFQEIKGTINNVDYYDFFEKVIEDILLKLNSLNAKLYPEGKPDKQARRKNLADIKELYTMKSERLIHMQVETDTEVESGIAGKDSEEEEDSLELF